MTSWQKAIKYAAIALATFLIINIIGGIVGTVATLSYVFDDKENIGEMENYKIMDNIKKLDIDVGAVNFVIKTGDSFKLESNNEKITVKENNGSLIIKQKHSLNFGKRRYNLEISIPEDTVFDDVYISTGAGRLTVDTLKAERIDLDLGAGEAKFNNLTALKKLEIDGGAGAIIIENGKLANADFNLGVGTLKLTSILTGVCDIDCGVGETRLTLLGDREDYRIDIDKGIGDAVIDGEKRKDGDVYGSGSNRVSIDGGIGKIDVQFERIIEVE